MTLCVSALKSEAPELTGFGCCHEVFGTQKILGGVGGGLVSSLGASPQRKSPWMAGVNHFTWATKVRWKGHDLMPRLKAHVAEPDFFRTRRKEAEKAAGERRVVRPRGFGGIRSLAKVWCFWRRAEIVVIWWNFSWYLQERRGIAPLGCGPHALCLAAETQPTLGAPWVKSRPTIRRPPEKRWSSRQIEALLGLRELTTNVNLPNVGPDARFSLSGPWWKPMLQFKHNAIVPLVAAGLEPGAASLVRRTIDEQNRFCRQRGEGDGGLALQALLLDPLVSLPVDDAASMLREMLEAVHSSFLESSTRGLAEKPI